MPVLTPSSEGSTLANPKVFRTVDFIWSSIKSIIHYRISCLLSMHSTTAVLLHVNSPLIPVNFSYKNECKRRNQRPFSYTTQLTTTSSICMPSITPTYYDGLFHVHSQSQSPSMRNQRKLGLSSWAICISPGNSNEQQQSWKLSKHENSRKTFRRHSKNEKSTADLGWVGRDTNMFVVCL